MNQIVPITPDTNSYSYIIRDGILGRLKQLPIFSTSVKKWAKTKFFIKQHTEFPFVGVYFVDEAWMAAADGNHNAGAPHFFHTLRLGYSVVVVNNDPEASEYNLDQAHWAIFHLFDAQLWHRFDVPPGFDPIEIEGVTRGSRNLWYGNGGLNNDLPLAELRMEMTYAYRTDWPPTVKDGFLKMGVIAAGSWPYDPGAGDSFTAVFDVPQTGPLPKSVYDDDLNETIPEGAFPDESSS
jgi:hypothetical protein